MHCRSSDRYYALPVRNYFSWEGIKHVIRFPAHPACVCELTSADNGSSGDQKGGLVY